MTGRLSALAYLACVLLVTAAGIGAAIALRPAFAFSVRELVGLEKPRQAAPGSFYTARVAPLVAQHCASCHGARIAKADLRLDSFAGTMRGGKHGAVIQPGRAKESELFYRITLPSSDLKAMPPEGKTPLTKDEMTVIRLWIAAGAAGDLPVGAIKGAPKLVSPVQIPDDDPKAVARQRAALVTAVRALQARFPRLIDYESRGTADLDVKAALAKTAFGDAELRALTPLRARIVALDLSGTAVTDAAAPEIAAMRSLRVLRLMDTAVTDVTIRAVQGLPALRSLTIAGTTVTNAAVIPLRQRGVAVHGGGDG